MTDEEKQIEEMARVICDGCHVCNHVMCHEWYTAKKIYDAGYRKQIEGEWISVDERLPKRPGAYLTYTFRGYTKISHFEEWAIDEAPSFDDYTVTHWMPLPDPPKMKGGENE